MKSEGRSKIPCPACGRRNVLRRYKTTDVQKKKPIVATTCACGWTYDENVQAGCMYEVLDDGGWSFICSRAGLAGTSEYQGPTRGRRG